MQLAFKTGSSFHKMIIKEKVPGGVGGLFGFRPVSSSWELEIHGQSKRGRAPQKGASRQCPRTVPVV
jgi:hypothetical protein